jgi:hypothetical protein
LVAVGPLPTRAPCSATCLSMSVENRTRGEASEDSRDIEGRDAFSTAELRAAGVASINLWGSSIVYGVVVVSAAFRVVGDSSSSSCGAELRLRMPSLGGSPAPVIVDNHLMHVCVEAAMAKFQPARRSWLCRVGRLAACLLRGLHYTSCSRHGGSCELSKHVSTAPKVSPMLSEC